jgi:hypothetical protein
MTAHPPPQGLVPPNPPNAIPSGPEEAKRFYLKGDFERTIQTYNQLLEATPNSPEVYAGLTRVYLKNKDVDRAYEIVTKGLRAADSPVVRVALGEVYFRKGKIPEAEQEWVKVIKSGHEDARAYLGLARVREALSLYKSGRAMTERAYQLDPSDPQIRRAWVFGLSRAKRIEYLEEYLAGETNDDANTRMRMQHYLEYLKARAKGPRGGCQLVSKTSATETKLVRLMVDPIHMYGYGLNVAVNGLKSRLQLDTGASGLLINRNLAERAAVTRLSNIVISGIGDKGGQSGYTGLANKIQIGDLEFHNCTVAVDDKRSVVGNEGLIGPDVFDALLVELDFPNEKLRLSELPKRPGEAAISPSLQTDNDDSDHPEGALKDRYIAPEMTGYTAVYRFGHNLLVPTSIGNAPIKLFVLDTGSDQTLVSSDAAREVTAVRGDSNTIVRGLSGSVKNVYRADEAVIQFGHVRQEIHYALAFDLDQLSDQVNTEVSGIVGFMTLHFLDIRIDYRDGLVDFKYDPKRWN